MSNQTVHIGSKPRGVLKRATGLPDMVLNLGQRKKEDMLSKYSCLLSSFQKQALLNPGVTQYHYCEENGYEHELRVTYDEATNALTTNNLGCPRSFNHHIGDTCSMCGQKD